VKHLISVDVGGLTEETFAEVQVRIHAILSLEKLGTDADHRTYESTVRAGGLTPEDLEKRTREVRAEGHWPELAYVVTDSVSALPPGAYGSGRLTREIL